MTPLSHASDNARLWKLSLMLFALAGLTGALYRFGISSGWVLGLELVNIRHAHSHLMYMGWATPALFALIAHQSPEKARSAVVIVGLTLLAALVAFPLFLLFGYTATELGALLIPPAVVLSGANILCWYAFAVWYLRIPTPTQYRSQVFLAMAIGFMVLATVGAWGLAAAVPLGLSVEIWPEALKHLFLDTFSEGWFVLGVLGLAYRRIAPTKASGHWSVWLLMIGMPFIFLASIPEALLTRTVRTIATVGSVVVAAALLSNIWTLWRESSGRAFWLWRLALFLLALKIGAQLLVALGPRISWTTIPGLRVLYLHLMLLGFVTLGLAAAAHDAWKEHAERGRYVLAAAVVLLLACLVTLTPILPVSLRGSWTWTTAAWVSLGPALAAIWMSVARGKAQ